MYIYRHMCTHDIFIISLEGEKGEDMNVKAPKTYPVHL